MMYRTFSCARCGGILLGGVPPAGTLRCKEGDQWYHYHCHKKVMEERMKYHEDRKTERGHNPVLPKD